MAKREAAAKVAPATSKVAGIATSRLTFISTLRVQPGHRLGHVPARRYAGLRGFLGLEAGKVLLGIWLIISPFILAVTYPIQAPTFWSNIWSGGVIAVLALASLACMRRHAEGDLRR